MFDSGATPWVSPQSAPVNLIVAIVKNCPTEAPTYSLMDSRGVPAEQPEFASVVVTMSPDGPLEVAGKIRVASIDGVTLKEHDRFWLCLLRQQQQIILRRQPPKNRLEGRQRSLRRSVDRQGAALVSRPTKACVGQ